MVLTVNVSNMDYAIIGIGDGFLLGVTYYGKDDRVDEEDWSELNIYLGLIAINIRWW